MRLQLLPGAYAVARFGADEAVLAGILEALEQGRGSEGGGFVAVSRTDEELSVVALVGRLDDAERPESTQYRVDFGRSRKVGKPLRALRVAGTLDHSLTGVLLSLAAPLADAGVPIFAVSTFDTDYVLVPEERLEEALAALRAAGHELDA